MTVETVIKRARRRLGDSDMTGWDDATLIDLVDQGQKNLCRIARVYKRTAYLGLKNEHRLYLLPLDCFQVDRVEYLDKYMAVLSREDSDARYTEKGMHIIKSNLNMGTLELSEAFSDLDNYANFTDGDNIRYELDSPYGVITLVNEGTLDTTLGVVTEAILELSDEEIDDARYGNIDNITFNGPLQVIPTFGVTAHIPKGEGLELFGFLASVDENRSVGLYGPCTDALVLENYLKVYYSAMPSTVNSLYDALVVSDIWLKALVHYVVGMARQDDNDEGNYAIGEAEIVKYREEVRDAEILSAKNFSSSVQEARETTYRRV